MSVEAMRESRNGATVIFTQFTRLQEKFPQNIFCCFEGDDAKYYIMRVKSITDSAADKIIPFNCGGKREVFRLYNMINKDTSYSTCRLFYFIDRDFDPVNTIPNIYETPVYSIENFYTVQSVFSLILKSEFNYNEDDKEFDFLNNAFVDRQREFHEKTALFNVWLACQRDKSNAGIVQRLNLDSFNLLTIVPIIDLDKIESNYDLQRLTVLFPDAAQITEAELDEKMDVFLKQNAQEIFRGKFEIDFLFSFLESLKIEFKKANARIKKKPGFQMNQSKKNMISEFSQYAFTPNCLVEYLKRN